MIARRATERDLQARRAGEVFCGDFSPDAFRSDRRAIRSMHAPGTRAAMPKARALIAVNPAASSPAPMNFRSPHLEVPPLRALDCIVNSRDVSVSISRHAHRFQQQQIFVVCVTRCTDAMSTRRVCVLLCATNLPQSHAVVAIDASLRTTRRRTNARSWGSMRHRLHQSLELPVPTI